MLYSLFKLKQVPKLSLTWLDITVMLWLLWLVFTTFFTSVNVIDSFFGEVQRTGGLIHWLALGFYYFWLRIFLPLDRQTFWRTLQMLFVFSGSLVSLYGLLAFFMGLTEGHKFYATFNNESFAAYFLSLTLITTYVWWLENKEQNASRWGLIALLIQAVALWLAQTRWAYAITFGGLIIAYWLISKNNSKIKADKKGLSLLGLLGAASVVLVSFLTKGLAYFSLNSNTFEYRLDAWRISFEAWLAKPIFGWGLENFNDAFNAHYQPLFEEGGASVNLWFDRAHNFILENLVTLGVGGFVILAIIALVALWVGLKNIKSAAIAPWATVIILAYFGNNLLSFETMPTTIIFISALAYLGGLLPPFKIFKASQILANSYVTISVAMIFAGFLWGAIPWFAHQNAIVHLTTSGLRDEQDLAELTQILKPAPYLIPQIALYTYGIYPLPERHSYSLLAEYMMNHQNQFKDNPEFQGAIATTWDKSDDPQKNEKVKAGLLNVLKISPRSAFTWLNLAIAEVNLGDYSAALKSINKALELNPDTKEATNIKNKILAFIQEEQAKEGSP